MTAAAPSRAPLEWDLAAGLLVASSHWDQRYREGSDRWELGRAAPPLAAFLQTDGRAPKPPGRVLVPGCGRGHEAALLADLGFEVVGLDFSTEAIQGAQRRHGPNGPRLRWLQADLFDRAALDAAGLTSGSLQGVLEHTCFCAIDPGQRQTYLQTVGRLLAPEGWFLGLLWCHQRPGGPPWGSRPAVLAQQVGATGLQQQLWEPAQGSIPEREDEWLGLWQRPAAGSRGFMEAT